MVSIGRVYRRDAITATRYPIFHQFEGLAVDEGLTLADLKGTLLHVMRELYGPDRRVRFRTHYFPFTEPSIEPDVSCGICGGAGCRTCKFSGWIEMGGAGMVDPRVFENVGLDPERVERLRVRLRARARRAAASRRAGHPRPLGGRPPRAEAVLAVRVPISWLSRVRAARDAARGARDAAVDRLGRGRGDRDARRRRHRRQPRPLPGRPRARGEQASERRPAAAHEGRRGRGRGRARSSAAPGTSAPGRPSRWRCPAPCSRTGSTLERRKVRGEISDGMILAEDEVDLGADHTGSCCSRTARSRARRSRDVLPLARVDPGGRVDRQPSRPALGLRDRPRGGGALRPARSRRSPARRRSSCPAAPVDIQIDDFEGCPRYIGRLFEHVRIAPSPVWLKARLLAAGMRPISNVVDVTNYVMLALGNPLHAFDFDDAPRAAGSSCAAPTPASGCARSTASTASSSRRPDDRRRRPRRSRSPGSWAARRPRSARRRTTVLLEAANFEPHGLFSHQRAPAAPHRGLEPLGEGRRPVPRRARREPRDVARCSS